MSFRDRRLSFKASTNVNSKTKKLVGSGLTNTHIGKATSKTSLVQCNYSGINIYSKRNNKSKDSEIRCEEESWHVCESCHLLLTTSREYVKCCRELLANARLLFLDDVQHHHRGVEAWERVLQALDAAHLPSECKIDETDIFFVNQSE